jgi:hypothetical protein
MRRMSVLTTRTWTPKFNKELAPIAWSGAPTPEVQVCAASEGIPCVRSTLSRNTSEASLALFEVALLKFVAMVFRPDGPVLPAGGMGMARNMEFGPQRAIRSRSSKRTALAGPALHRITFPGLRPGLVEPALQTGKQGDEPGSSRKQNFEACDSG